VRGRGGARRGHGLPQHKSAQAPAQASKWGGRRGGRRAQRATAAMGRGRLRRRQGKAGQVHTVRVVWPQPSSCKRRLAAGRAWCPTRLQSDVAGGGEDLAKKGRGRWERNGIKASARDGAPQGWPKKRPAARPTGHGQACAPAIGRRTRVQFLGKVVGGWCCGLSTVDSGGAGAGALTDRASSAQARAAAPR
jgi:hypothetical protein